MLCNYVSSFQAAGHRGLFLIPSRADVLMISISLVASVTKSGFILKMLAVFTFLACYTIAQHVFVWLLFEVLPDKRRCSDADVLEPELILMQGNWWGVRTISKVAGLHSDSTVESFLQTCWSPQRRNTCRLQPAHCWTPVCWTAAV